MNVDKNPSCPPAFAACQQEGDIQNTKLRWIKYLNNIQEQDHRSIKRRVCQSQWLQSFFTAKKTISGYESMYMIRKGQVKYLSSSSMVDQKKFVENLFGIAA
jgi:IS6 family transposase